ncbi:MAG TPA: DUF6069 family protein [Streptosporangiaceae bacterium]|nr:DUF6069 family protein [Streptosporangiaceae bacterium]
MTTAPMPPEPSRGGYGSSASIPDDYRPGGTPPIRPRPSRPQVDAGKLWPGGIATAVVAALVALVGVLVCRWLFGIPLLAPKSDGAYGDVHTTDLVLIAAAAALVATGLVHLLLLSTPRPLTFFAWIIGLATVLAVLVPFSTAAPLTAKVATSAVDLVLGVAIGSLISGVAARSVRVPAGADGAYLGAGADGIG